MAVLIARFEVGITVRCLLQVASSSHVVVFF